MRAIHLVCVFWHPTQRLMCNDWLAVQLACEADITLMAGHDTHANLMSTHDDDDDDDPCCHTADASNRLCQADDAEAEYLRW